jgi:hypothetical protein
MISNIITELYRSLATRKSSWAFLAIAAGLTAYPTIGPQPISVTTSSF